MTTADRQGGLLRTGRPLDDGTPTDGPALELDPDGRGARLLAASPHALVSSPGAGVWATLLARPGAERAERAGIDGADTDRPVLLQWLAPDAAAPPAHVHPTTETFEGVTGELTLVVDGDDRRLGPGETVTVESGQPHTFRNDTDETVAFRAALPSMQTVAGLYTVWRLDHEGAFGDDGAFGEPGPRHALPVAADLFPETTVTGPPPVVQRVVLGTVGRILGALGYDGVDDRSLDDAFWERHVEQPPV